MDTIGLSADTARLAATPSPWGAPGGPGLWHHKGWKLPNYVEQVSKGIMKSGRAASESEAIHMALGVLARWARGGGNVTPEVRAAAAKAIAEFAALKAKAAASHSHANDGDSGRFLDLAFTEALAERVPPGRPDGGRFVPAVPALGRYDTPEQTARAVNAMERPQRAAVRASTLPPPGMTWGDLDRLAIAVTA